MVRSKVFTKEEAVGIYDLFFNKAPAERRESDLVYFAPLPPRKPLPWEENEVQTGGNQ